MIALHCIYAAGFILVAFAWYMVFRNPRQRPIDATEWMLAFMTVVTTTTLWPLTLVCYFVAEYVLSTESD